MSEGESSKPSLPGQSLDGKLWAIFGNQEYPEINGKLVALVMEMMKPIPLPNPFEKELKELDFSRLINGPFTSSFTEQILELIKSEVASDRDRCAKQVALCARMDNLAVWARFSLAESRIRDGQAIRDVEEELFRQDEKSIINLIATAKREQMKDSVDFMHKAASRWDAAGQSPTGDIIRRLAWEMEGAL